jgi:membrane protein
MDMIKKRFLSMAMVFGIIFLLLVSMFVTSMLSLVLDKVVGGGDDNAGFIANAIGFVSDFVTTVLVVGVLFTLIFKYLPDVNVRFRDVWMGGLVTAVLFKLGQYALAAYFNFGSTTSAYGAAGSLVAVLLWAYYSACILLFGAEFTQVYAKMFGARIEPDKDAVPVTDEERAQHGMPRQKDLQESADAVATGAAHRGGAVREPLRPPRVVTITQPAPTPASATALATAGVAAGLIIGAIGWFKGRKYTATGLGQIRLNERLSRLESRLGRGKPMEIAGAQVRIGERMNNLDARMRRAANNLRRNANPNLLDRVAAYLRN